MSRSQAFDRNGLSRQVRQDDYRQYRTVLTQGTREQLVSDAVNCAEKAFNGKCGLKHMQRGTRVICSVDEYPTVLVLRKIADNLSSLVVSTPAERSRIVKVLTLFLGEQAPYRLYRFDIERFFDSLTADEALRCISSSLVSQKTRELLAKVLSEHNTAGYKGIPTGLTISTTLAEAMMATFDHYVRTLPNVFYFGRFVDDIVIVTSGIENAVEFQQNLSKALPVGTRFGDEKQTLFSVPIMVNGKAAIHNTFEYLGYSFVIRDEIVVENKKSKRIVDVNLSEKSFNKSLTRLARAFRCFAKDSNFNDLNLRIRYLTSNYRLYDPVVKRQRLAGVFHNHPFLTGHRGNSLQRLDLALRKLIFASSTWRVGKLVILSPSQQRCLANRSFSRGHSRKEYCSFSIKTIALIKRCWYDA